MPVNLPFDQFYCKHCNSIFEEFPLYFVDAWPHSYDALHGAYAIARRFGSNAWEFKSPSQWDFENLDPGSNRWYHLNSRLNYGDIITRCPNCNKEFDCNAS